MLWVKAFHVVFVIAWMVGIFYLPRIFVHYVEGKEAGEDVRRLEIMADKLYKFTSIMSVLAVIPGLALWLHYGLGKGMGWMHAKLLFVLLLGAYHVFCGRLLKELSAGTLSWSGKSLRWFNELPLLFMVGIVILAIVKPF